MVHTCMRRSAIDTAAARAAPGVLAVFTGADAAADHLNPIPHNPTWEGPPDVAVRVRPGFIVFKAPHAALPAERVRFVGEAVAMVVAESIAAARDAADLVAVDYEPLPAVALASDAIEPGAALLWEGCRPEPVARLRSNT